MALLDLAKLLVSVTASGMSLSCTLEVRLIIPILLLRFRKFLAACIQVRLPCASELRSLPTEALCSLTMSGHYPLRALLRFRLGLSLLGVESDSDGELRLGTCVTMRSVPSTGPALDTLRFVRPELASERHSPRRSSRI